MPVPIDQPQQAATFSPMHPTLRPVVNEEMPPLVRELVNKPACYLSGEEERAVLQYCGLSDADVKAFAAEAMGSPIVYCGFLESLSRGQRLEGSTAEYRVMAQEVVALILELVEMLGDPQMKTTLFDLAYGETSPAEVLDARLRQQLIETQLVNDELALPPLHCTEILARWMPKLPEGVVKA